MEKNYEVDIWWSEENNCYMAVAPDLPGCIADGETEQEARNEINKSIKIWLEVNTSRGLENPNPIYCARQKKADDYQERINMLTTILMALTGIEENRLKKMIKDTCIYKAILERDEIALHEGYLINTLDIISELKKRKVLSVESDKVYDLCQLMSETKRNR